MKSATLIYNPKAGSGAYSEKELMTLIEENGYNCRLLSTKKDKWKKLSSNTDLIIVAGGDGTVRKVITKLLDKKTAAESPPLAILPLGTANNVMKTLYGKKNVKQIIASWKKASVIKHDVGVIEGISRPDFFLESFGFGIFPSFMKKLKKGKINLGKTPGEQLKTAQKIFHQCIVKSKPYKCRLKIDGKDYSGKYFSVEVMNTASLGPNLKLAPTVDMTDGQLDVVLINEKNKHRLDDYVFNKAKQKKITFRDSSIKAKKISIRWHNSHAHADGELVKLHNGKIKISVGEKVLKFLV